MYNGSYIADSTNARYVWEHPFYPQYYLPRSAFDNSKVIEGDKVRTDSGEHVATIWTIKVGEKSTDRAVCFNDNLTGKAKDLSGLVKANFRDFGMS